jgi:hypothetical protein
LTNWRVSENLRYQFKTQVKTKKFAGAALGAAHFGESVSAKSIERKRLPEVAQSKLEKKNEEANNKYHCLCIAVAWSRDGEGSDL